VRPRRVVEVAGVLPLRAARPDSFTLDHLPTDDGALGPPPISISGREDWRPSTIVGPPVRAIVTIPRGIASTNGHAFTADGLAVLPASHKHRSELGAAVVRRPWRPLRRIEHVDGCIAGLSSSLQRWYFHWLFDILPRVALLREAGVAVDRYYVARSEAYQDVTLDLLGIGRELTIDCTSTPFVATDVLVVPNHQVTSGRPIPHRVTGALRDWFLPHVSPSTERRRLFVSRAGASYRRVENEQEVFASLADHGFECVELERLGFLDQVRLFAEAEAVVAPHGGGLANLVFCRPGTGVVELFPPTPIDLYQRVSNAVGLPYAYVRASGTTDRLTKDDYTIAPLDVLRALEALGLGR
jgi:hypothetical protein